MATIRQHGGPNLFVTMSSAEYHWEGLLKSCYEAKYRRAATQEVLENMSDAKKSRLITESVTQTTLHFEKRVVKLVREFLKPGWFQDDREDGFEEINTEDDQDDQEDIKPSYFYRIEFQVKKY